MRNFLGVVGCKTIIYLERVARGLSICTTCLLSVVQAVTISPRTTLCRKLKPQTAWQVFPFLLLFWIFNFLISSNLPHYLTAARSTNRSGAGMHTEYCHMLPSRNTVKWLFITLITLRDVVFQSLMGWSSGSMALRLYKHHIRVLYLHSSRKEEMVLKFIKETIFLLMTTVGTLGNISVSVNYMFSWCLGPEKKPIYLILIHLAVTNIIILLAKGLPNTMVAFGLRNFLDDIGCKILIYLERVARGLSICTSSLLTVVQAIIISPGASQWRRLRPKSVWHIFPFFSFFWVLNALIGMNLIHSITSTSRNISQFKSESNCYFMLESQKTKWIVLSLMVLRDAVFQGAMGGASGYMEEMVLKFIKQIVFLFMTVFGTLGNISVSVNYMFSWCLGPEKKPIHLILIHLAFTNIIILLAKGLPNTMVAFGLRNFLDDIGCKILIYLERVARGLSICTSSLLTVVQAIIISPGASQWRRLRPESAWHILPFFSFFWILNALISMNLIHSITSINLNISQLKNGYSYCHFKLESQKTKWIVLPLMVLRDAVFQGAMGGASGYMVLLLHKHHQHVLYLQNSKLLYRTPPELRAAQKLGEGEERTGDSGDSRHRPSLHVLLLRRVARGLSICTSGLLTVVQAIIISPRASWWGSLKLRSPEYVLLSLLFFWILNSVISMNILHSIRNRGTNTLQLSINDRYCYFRKESQKINNIFLMLMVLRDAVFQGAMGGASGYM
ncbi:hypothetical protein U0070_027582, partial [Myodes glareolus]